MVGIPASSVLAMVSLMYGLPLLAGLLGAVLGHVTAGNQGWAAGPRDFMALGAGLLAGGLVLKFLRPRMRRLASRSNIKVMRVINRSSPNSVACGLTH